MCRSVAGFFGACSLQQSLQNFFNLSGAGDRSITTYHVAAAIDEELSEVPLDRFGTQDTSACTFQVLIERMYLRTIHAYLREQRECYIVHSLTKGVDL